MRECKSCNYISITGEWPTIPVPFMTARVVHCPECFYTYEVVWP